MRLQLITKNFKGIIIVAPWVQNVGNNFNLINLACRQVCNAAFRTYGMVLISYFSTDA
jgi:hypothetical protein